MAMMTRNNGQPELRIFAILAFLILGLLTHPSFGDGSLSKRYTSPKGKFEVLFENPNEVVSPDPDRVTATPGFRTIRYRISFYKPGSQTDIATTDFYDVGPKKADTAAMNFSELVKQMVWSPEEDFVILPEESWPNPQMAAAVNPPGSIGRKAVSLNTIFPWLTASIPLDANMLIWANSTILVGNFRDSCRLSVNEFDAKTGKLTSVSQADLPAGYVIVSGDQNQILMKKVLGPCAKPEEAKSFVPECTYLDLQFGRRHMSACPS
jgi:hypothetical protein